MCGTSVDVGSFLKRKCEGRFLLKDLNLMNWPQNTLVTADLFCSSVHDCIVTAVDFSFLILVSLSLSNKIANSQ